MVVMFLTSYQNKMGEEIKDSNQIAKSYMKSFRFFADSFAILGTNAITSLVPSFKFFGFFKMFRIMRLGTIITRMNVPEHVKALFNLAKLCFYLCLGVHIIGCTWFMIIKINKDKIGAEG